MGEILALDRAAFPGEPTWGPENFLAELPGKWALSFLAQEPSELVGFSISSTPPERTAHLHRIAVATDRRGSGIGRRLIEETLAALAPLPIDRYTLEVPDAQRASGFYDALGFRRIVRADEIEDYLARRGKTAKRDAYLGPRADRRIYVRELAR